jgi:hypothetical protein
MSVFAGKRVSHSHTIRLNDEPGIVFPLFTPEEEKKWAAGWDYELVYPPDAKPVEDMVFKTSTHDHNHQNNAIWIINKYEPGNFQIEYLRIEPGIKVGKIQIECGTGRGQETLATITYTYIGLSDLGNKFIEAFTTEHYHDFISAWERAINYYLETGQTLPASHYGQPASD